MREVLNTWLYLNRSGCPWDMLPHALWPKSTVDDSFAPWRAPTPRAAGSARQSVKTTEMGGPERGYDGGKKLQGRQRHLVVDTLGWWFAVLMTRAGRDDGVAAPTLLGLITPQTFPRRITIVADQQDHSHALDAWMAEHCAGWRLEVQGRPAGTRSVTPLEKRWVLERTHAWHGRYRRNSKDYERTTKSSTAMSQISHRHLILNRFSSCGRPAFHYRKEAA